MTLDELNDIKKPELTMMEIYRRLSDDERTELRKIALREAYPGVLMHDLWKSLRYDEREQLIRAIITSGMEAK